MDARRAAQAARHPQGDVEALADIRIDHLRKDSLGRDGLTSAHVQQIWRINTVQGARSFSPRSVMYAAMSETALHGAGARAQARWRRGGSPGLRRPAGGRARLVDVLRLAHRAICILRNWSRATWWRSSITCCPPPRSIPGRDTTRSWICSATRLPTRLRRRVVIAPSAMKLYAVEHGLRRPWCGRTAKRPRGSGRCATSPPSPLKRFRREPARAAPICMSPPSGPWRSLAAGTAGCWSPR